MDQCIASWITPFPIVPPGGDTHPAKWRRELQRIIKKVGKNILQFKIVKVNRFKSCIGKKIQSSSARRIWNPPLFNHFCNAFIYASQVFLDFKLSRLQRADFEEALN